ncbi:MAG: hypothetical protein AAF221_09505 [Pseudomonadota bacterium]
MNFSSFIAGAVFCMSSVLGAANAATINGSTTLPATATSAGPGDILESPATFTFPGELFWSFSTTVATKLTFSTYGDSSTSGGSLAGLYSTNTGAPPPVDISTQNCSGRITSTNLGCFVLRPEGSNANGPQPGTILFSNLAPGDYVLEIDDQNNTPQTALIQFTLSEVPIPAAGILFGSALFGAAFLRRRSIQKTLGMPTAA